MSEVVCIGTSPVGFGPGYLSQLAFTSEKSDGQKVVYGPYGNGCLSQEICRLFTVSGKINSIFGQERDDIVWGACQLGKGSLKLYLQSGSMAAC